MRETVVRNEIKVYNIWIQQKNILQRKFCITVFLNSFSDVCKINHTHRSYSYMCAMYMLTLLSFQETKWIIMHILWIIYSCILYDVLFENMVKGKTTDTTAQGLFFLYKTSTDFVSWGISMTHLYKFHTWQYGHVSGTFILSDIWQLFLNIYGWKIIVI